MGLYGGKDHFLRKRTATEMSAPIRRSFAEAGGDAYFKSYEDVGCAASSNVSPSVCTCTYSFPMSSLLWPEGTTGGINPGKMARFSFSHEGVGYSVSAYTVIGLKDGKRVLLVLQLAPPSKEQRVMVKQVAFSFNDYVPLPCHFDKLLDAENPVVTFLAFPPGRELPTLHVHLGLQPPDASLGADLASGLASGRGADVALRCGGEELRAHSQLLAARSPVLAAQLASSPGTRALAINPDVSPSALRRLLEYAYTGRLDPQPSYEEATHLLAAADAYQLPGLVTLCERTLGVFLRVENAAETLLLADQHSSAALRKAAMNFIATCHGAVRQTPGWKDLLKRANGAELADAVMAHFPSPGAASRKRERDE